MDNRDRDNDAHKGGAAERADGRTEERRFDKPAHGDRPNRPAHGGRPDRPSRDGKPEGRAPFRPRGDRPERPARDDRSEGRAPFRPRGDRPDRPARDDRSEGRAPFRPRGDRPDRPPRGDRPEGRAPFRPRGDAPPNRDLAALQDLDTELLRLIARRASLLEKLRGPSARGRLDAGLEKKLRASWEDKAGKISRDGRLAHDMFVLLQSIEPPARSLFGDEGQSFFNLAPPQKPVDIHLSASADTVTARSWLALAMASGKIMALEQVPLTGAVVDGVKALNQMGAQLWWEETGAVLSRGGGGLQRGMDKVIHVGDDAFNFWLVLAFSLGMPSRLKITGGSDLRFLDLTEVRHFLPSMGARLTNIIPGQEGLPIRLECSGMLPADIALPAALPSAFVQALLLAAPFWEHTVRFLLSGQDALDGLRPALAVLRKAGASLSLGTMDVVVTPGPLNLPEKPSLPLDATVAASLLAMPALAGGGARLDGLWPADAGSALAERLLRGLGLEFFSDGEHVFTGKKDGRPEAPSADLVAAILREAPDLLPLAVVAAAAAVRAGKPAALPLPSGEAVDPLGLLDGFLAQLGLKQEEDGTLVLLDDESQAAYVWVAPNAHWAMGAALAAFLRPRIRLANPGLLADLYPPFWAVYNGLPKPDLTPKTAPEPVHVPSTRRRVIARGVYADIPSDVPSGDAS